MKVRPFYAYYVSHIIRQYFSEHPPSAPTEAYALNRESVKRVADSLGETEYKLLKELYSGPYDSSLAVRVETASEHLIVPKDKIWDFIADTERRIARERGLI